jgi:hypothetical protein
MGDLSTVRTMPEYEARHTQARQDAKQLLEKVRSNYAETCSRVVQLLQSILPNAGVGSTNIHNLVSSSVICMLDMHT